ncbi:GTP-binding protein [Streptomyces flaveolus]|uniref:sulfate adenylyltransferase subunit 1 n=1 Tax=Streptomyces flaveolus TaxID=67297 RepID=UPI00342D33DD
MHAHAPARRNRDGSAALPGLLRLAAVGSVDDGKSTLVGRLMYDAKAILADQWEALGEVSRQRGTGEPDLALLTDGLRAEREQGITIDVAYRYFATPRRRFVLADTPGHVEYTRNAVTGLSTADLAVVLVDARHGVVEQTRRHAAVAALLRVPHVVLAVNKMDLVDHREAAFTSVASDFEACARSLGLPPPSAVPVAARPGDNVVRASEAMPWYTGPTLLELLESAPVAEGPGAEEVRLPVQCVLRADDGHRRYAGRLTAGELRTGDRITVLPSGRTSTVAAIDVLGRPTRTARAPQSIAVRLADELDVGRGDLIVTGEPPAAVTEIHATVCHLHEHRLRAGDRVLLRHTTRTVRARVTAIGHRLDVGRMHRDAAVDGLGMNDIGRITVRTAEPVPVDAYRDHRETGAFLLLDPSDGSTVTAGMAEEPGPLAGDGL